jgi:predicted enzyme related to lactoylglutathione lyase
MARPNFIELPARDYEKSKTFYQRVFAWTLTEFGPSYACTMTGDVDIGLQGDAAEASAAPLPVICVDDLEAALAAVTAAGGTIVKPVFSFPGGRRFQFLDPSGNELAVMAPEVT